MFIHVCRSSCTSFTLTHLLRCSIARKLKIVGANVNQNSPEISRFEANVNQNSPEISRFEERRDDTKDQKEKEKRKKKKKRNERWKEKINREEDVIEKKMYMYMCVYTRDKLYNVYRLDLVRVHFEYNKRKQLVSAHTYLYNII